MFIDKLQSTPVLYGTILVGQNYLVHLEQGMAALSTGNGFNDTHTGVSWNGWVRRMNVLQNTHPLALLEAFVGELMRKGCVGLGVSCFLAIVW